MSESKRATAHDADRPMHPDDIGWDPDDAPELDEGWFTTADRHMGETLIARGLRSGETETFVLPTELVDQFRATGPVWQIRIESALKDRIREHADRL